MLKYVDPVSVEREVERERATVVVSTHEGPFVSRFTAPQRN
jgi:hypothetical protein